MFKIRMGIPGMERFWNELIKSKRNGTINTDDDELFRKLVKTFQLLSQKPRYPGLQTHEITQLSRKYGFKVWQSYIDQGNQANRLYWAYGPNRREITILGIEPHPEDKKRGTYERIKLSDLPPRTE